MQSRQRTKRLPGKLPTKLMQMKNKKLVNRMFVNGRNSCFITLKDQKENFLNNPKVNLLKPAKHQLGRISKYILNRINTSVRTLIKVNQWKDTSEIIEWFKNIGNCQKHNSFYLTSKIFIQESRKIY